MTPKWLFGFAVTTLGLAQLLQASEHVCCKSPDGKFALRETLTELNPVHGDTAIIEMATGKVIVQLHGDAPVATERLRWSLDSRRVAYFRNDSQSGATRIFFRNGSAFEEIKMPELLRPQLPELPKADGSNGETMRRTEPIRWTYSGDLILEDELQKKAGTRAANQITVDFEQNKRAIVRKNEREKMSILDYFLLLPPKTLESPANEWLFVMRANGDTIDKANGCMSCPGDGAQPEFEVALFRYRDPAKAGLLAFCNGELEGDDSAFLYFFELGADGKMRDVSRPILPINDLKYDAESGYEKGTWRFDLPRRGKTIVVRTRKGGKILHRFTWNGEKFQEEQ